jgi:hypothetical protein
MCLAQIGFWDEVHKKFWISNVREGTSDYKEFPRNDDGKYNPNGKYKPEGESGGVVQTVKYEKEVRLCIGVAMKVNCVGEEEGIRLDPYDYSTMTILSINDYKDYKTNLINTVKKLSPSVGNGWMTSVRLPDVIYRSDDLKIMKGRPNSEGKGLGMGQKKIDYFRTMNYNTVGDVGDLNGNDEAINNLVAGMRGLSKPVVQRIIDVCCLNVHDGTP